jgi:type IV pilus assembly protein PilQ
MARQKKLFLRYKMNSKHFTRLIIISTVLLNLGLNASASFEAKIILLDIPNKLMAIDKGSDQGLNKGMLFYVYRRDRLVCEASIFKTSKQVSICEIRNLAEEERINLNDLLIFLTEEEKSKLKEKEISSGVSETPIAGELDLKKKAQEISKEEEVKRKLEEVLVKEKAKGIAEAIKIEKELQKLKEEARQIVEDVIEEKKKEKRIISFDFREADIKNAIKIIGREANANIVIPPDFTSIPITVNLNDVEFEEALNLILGMAEYTFVKEKNVYKVVKAEEAEKETTHITFAPRYIQVSKLKSLLTDGNLLSSEGKTIVDNRSNKIVVIDIPKKIEEIAEVVKQVDVKPRQVSIETKIIDVSLTDTEKLGIEWTWVKPRFPATDTDDVMKIGFTVDSTSKEGKGFFKYGTLNAVEIAAVIEAITKREHADILSKPIITTLNNEEAKINVVSKLPYQTGTTSTTTTGTTTTAVSWSEKEIGVTLTVTPYISEKGDIIMKIEPAASLLQEWVGEKISERYPIIMTRSATTQVMVKNGETIVIGGLITQEFRDTKSGIPLLSDIPVLGIPFQKKSKELKSAELMIFITPHIVPSIKEDDKTEERMNENG